MAEAPTTPSVVENAKRIRKIGLLLILVGGIFIIVGWGFGAETWARIVGWSLTGVGFACEMIYGQQVKNARAEQDAAAAQAAPETHTDESSP